MTIEDWTNRDDLLIVPSPSFVTFASVERPPGYATEQFFLGVIPVGAHLEALPDMPLVNFQFIHFVGEHRLTLIFTGRANLPDVRTPVEFRLAWMYLRQLGNVVFGLNLAS